MESILETKKIVDLDYLGFNIKGDIYRNLSTERLIEEGLINKETKMSMNGAVMVDTGIYTGRSPKDKYIVEENSTKDNIWWGDVNQKLSSDVYDELFNEVKEYYNSDNSKTYIFDGLTTTGFIKKEDLINNAYLYIDTPYLWGGRSPFGIDCSGFIQIIYRLQGFNLPRDAYQQAEVGITLSFVEESDPGDLAFFDDNEGKITHVGIIMENNHIIHASGKVRIDDLTPDGILHSKTKDKWCLFSIVSRLD